MGSVQGALPEVLRARPARPPALSLGGNARQALQFRLETFDLPPLRRLWFHSRDDTQIIQVQPDRFIYNWRRIKDEPYPRYTAVRDAFNREYEVFRQHVERLELDTIVADSCEVTYINQITPNEGWPRHGELSRVVKLWAPRDPRAFLPEPVGVQFTASYNIPNPAGQPMGRLSILVQPAARISDGTEILAMNLVATLQPAAPDRDGVLASLDVGRQWIVRAFADVTTDEMHQIWGVRHDG